LFDEKQSEMVKQRFLRVETSFDLAVRSIEGQSKETGAASGTVVTERGAAHLRPYKEALARGEGGLQRCRFAVGIGQD
jgi:hypothetical protein